MYVLFYSSYSFFFTLPIICDVVADNILYRPSPNNFFFEQGDYTIKAATMDERGTKRMIDECFLISDCDLNHSGSIRSDIR